MSGDLVAWLREQLDEDERVARTIELRSASPWRLDREPWAMNGVGLVDASADAVAIAIGDYAAEHIARWDPARVLREVEAKRRILDRSALYAYDLLRLLALPYSDRPGYRQEWVS